MTLPGAQPELFDQYAAAALTGLLANPAHAADADCLVRKALYVAEVCMYRRKVHYEGCQNPGPMPHPVFPNQEQS